MIIIHKNTVIHCTSCLTPLYNITRDCDEHDHVMAEDFTPVGEAPRPINGMQGVCFVCGHDFLSDLVHGARYFVSTQAWRFLERGFEIDIVTGEIVA